MIYNANDKLECYSSSGKPVCTISTDAMNFEELEWDDYDYTLDETYYPTNHDSVTLETSGITCNGKTIRSYIDLLNSQFNNLEGEEKLKAIAELAGGEITEQSMQFAKTLMDTSNN